jgi:tetratricopeptide (TPR) repeat protein
MEQNQRNHWLQFLAGLVIFVSGAVHGTETPATGAVDDRSLFQQAVALSQQGEWAQAAQMYSAIATRHPAWPEPKNNLAVALLKLGNMEQAQQALEDAVGSQPSFRTAQDNRQRLYDHLAAIAYDRALGKIVQNDPPQLQLLTRLDLPEPPPPAVLNPAPVTPPPAQQLVVKAEPNSAEQVSAAIRQHLLAWSQAWSQADVEAYLAAYSRRFKPAEPETDYNEWRNIRRARLIIPDNTRVKLEQIRVYMDGDHTQALAQFVQSYRSDTYQDRVLKQLHLALEKGRWLILSERVIEKLN